MKIPRLLTTKILRVSSSIWYWQLRAEIIYRRYIKDLPIKACSELVMGKEELIQFSSIFMIVFFIKNIKLFFYYLPRKPSKIYRMNTTHHSKRKTGESGWTCQKKMDLCSISKSRNGIKSYKVWVIAWGIRKADMLVVCFFFSFLFYRYINSILSVHFTTRMSVGRYYALDVQKIFYSPRSICDFGDDDRDDTASTNDSNYN